MGDQDGNGPGSAIFPDDIFYPPGQPDRTNPERTFANVGNNVYQPQNNDLATLALLKRLGDQQFVAQSKAPFEDYLAQQRLARDLNEASRNASLDDLGTSREILRNMAAERRQQNEDDFLRKMLDSGATPEAARKEIEDVRNANAIQEARKVEDRSYQAKMLIQRLAVRRGVTPMVKEPLTQSGAIENPQRSQAMSQAMGMPGEGFGTSDLDVNRQFMTPDFYKKFLRRSMLTQEAGDEMQAFSQNLAQGEIQPPSQGAFSMATLKGQQRQLQIENASEALAARLETIRSRANRLLLPLPPNVLAKDILDKLYKDKGKAKSNSVLFSSETIEDMKPLQLMIALNLITVSQPRGATKLVNTLKDFRFGTETDPSPTAIEDLKKIVVGLNGGELNISIPFRSVVAPLPTRKVVGILNNTKSDPAFQRETEISHKQFNQYMEILNELMGPEAAAKVPKAPSMNAEERRAGFLAALTRNVPTGTTAVEALAEVPVPGSSAPAAPKPKSVKKKA
jgi:hypothetical protein